MVLCYDMNKAKVRPLSAPILKDLNGKVLNLCRIWLRHKGLKFPVVSKTMSYRIYHKEISDKVWGRSSYEFISLCRHFLALQDFTFSIYIYPYAKAFKDLLSTSKPLKIYFPRQNLKRFTFGVKLSDSIFFLLGLSPIFKLIWHEKQIFFSLFRGKCCLFPLEIVKRPKNEIITLKSY